MTDSVDRSVERSVERLGTPVGTPVGQEVLRTDGRDGRTYEESFSPTRDNPSSSVTRTPAYGFSSDDSENTRPGWWTCFLCQPNVHERGGMDALNAHYMREHYVAPKATP